MLNCGITVPISKSVAEVQQFCTPSSNTTITTHDTSHHTLHTVSYFWMCDSCENFVGVCICAIPPPIERCENCKLNIFECICECDDCGLVLCECFFEEEDGDNED